MTTDGARGQFAPVKTPAFHRLTVLEHFLPPAVRSVIVAHVLEREDEFIESRVTSAPSPEPTPLGIAPLRPPRPVLDVEVRRSRVMTVPGPALRTMFVPYLRRAVDNVLIDPALAITSIELQVTASGEGDFYGPHFDKGPRRHVGRHLTFVYFFCTEPGCFEGGHLRIEPPGVSITPELETHLRSNTGHGSVTAVTQVEPRDNRLVMFPSHWRHEIRPVRVPTREFRHSRFTLNGWVHLNVGPKSPTNGRSPAAQQVQG